MRIGIRPSIGSTAGGLEFSGSAREYFHRRLLFDGTDVFTDTAPGAKLLFYVGLLQDQLLPGVVGLFNRFKPYRLLGDRTMFFADHTVELLCVRKTLVLIKDREPDKSRFLFLERKVRYCSGGADLPAQITVIFAVTETGNDHGCKETEESCLEGSRIERVPWADLHAFSATHALLQKLAVSVNTGGSQKP